MSNICYKLDPFTKTAKTKTGFYLTRANRTYQLDEVGLSILQNFDGQKNLDSIVAAIQEEYEGPEEQIRESVAHFINELIEIKLICQC